MLLINCRYNWPEAAGTHIRDKKRGQEYSCLHFRNPVKLSFGNTKISVREGAFIIIEPNIPIRYSSSKPYILDKMYIIGKVSDLLHMYGLQTNTAYYPSNQEEIIKIYESIEFGFYQKNSWEYRYTDIKFEELIIVIAQHCNEEKKYPANIEMYHCLNSLRQEMIAYPDRDWSVHIIAEQVGLSSSRLYPVYKSIFGISPNKDLIQIRIEHAKLLLKQGKTLSETAEQSGYDNISHFIRQFEKETGFTPKQFQLHA